MRGVFRLPFIHQEEVLLDFTRLESVDVYDWTDQAAMRNKIKGASVPRDLNLY